MSTRNTGSDRRRGAASSSGATEPEKLLQQHRALIHSQMRKVTSHVQREVRGETGDWYLNTLMIEGCEVPFKYKRKKLYRSLKGARVNLTYYPATETVAGFSVDIMSVVRVRIA